MALTSNFICRSYHRLLILADPFAGTGPLNGAVRVPESLIASDSASAYPIQCTCIRRRSLGMLGRFEIAGYADPAPFTSVGIPSQVANRLSPGEPINLAPYKPDDPDSQHA